MPSPSARPGVPRWASGLAVLALAGVLTGLILAPEGGTVGDPTQPLVDPEQEEQAIALLDLFETEAGAVERMSLRSELFSPPGPADAARVAADDVEALTAALTSARRLAGEDGDAGAYAADPGHDQVLQDLGALAVRAEAVAQVAGVHDGLYAGANAVGPVDPAAVLEQVSRPGDQRMSRWVDALRDQLRGADARTSALEARDGVAEEWRASVDELRPVVSGRLRTYLSGVPDRVAQGLRGHPRAGPALDRLDGDR